MQRCPGLEEHCLDPLLLILAKYRSWHDLLECIGILFNRLDIDGSRSIGMIELRDGLTAVVPGINVTIEEWYNITEEIVRDEMGVTDLSAADFHDMLEATEVSEEQFRSILLKELQGYLLRESNRALEGGKDPYDAMLMILRWVMIHQQSQEHLQNRGRGSPQSDVGMGGTGGGGAEGGNGERRRRSREMEEVMDLLKEQGEKVDKLAHEQSRSMQVGGAQGR